MSQKYDVQNALESVLENFEYLKRIVRENDKYLYERWKAGGFSVDGNFLSSYPAIDEVVTNILDGMEG